MTYLYNILIGYFAAAVGVIPPGLLNMSAAKISMKSGRKRALLFSAGVCATVGIQTFIALVFARYLDRHPEVIDVLQKIGVGIFFCLTLYFFFVAKDTRHKEPRTVDHSNANRFFFGMFLAALNLLPLPYWVYLSITFNDFGWFTFEQMGLWAASLAAAGGTFTMLAIYSQFFRSREKTRTLRMNMNYVIGSITALITIITLVKIFRDI